MKTKTKNLSKQKGTRSNRKKKGGYSEIDPADNSKVGDVMFAELGSEINLEPEPEPEPESIMVGGVTSNDDMVFETPPHTPTYSENSASGNVVENPTPEQVEEVQGVLDKICMGVWTRQNEGVDGTINVDYCNLIISLGPQVNKYFFTEIFQDNILLYIIKNMNIADDALADKIIQPEQSGFESFNKMINYLLVNGQANYSNLERQVPLVACMRAREAKPTGPDSYYSFLNPQETSYYYSNTISETQTYMQEPVYEISSFSIWMAKRIKDFYATNDQGSLRLTARDGAKDIDGYEPLISIVKALFDINALVYERERISAMPSISMMSSDSGSESEGFFEFNNVIEMKSRELVSLFGFVLQYLHSYNKLSDILGIIMGTVIEETVDGPVRKKKPKYTLFMLVCIIPHFEMETVFNRLIYMDEISDDPAVTRALFNPGISNVYTGQTALMYMFQGMFYDQEISMFKRLMPIEENNSESLLSLVWRSNSLNRVKLIEDAIGKKDRNGNSHLEYAIRYGMTTGNDIPFLHLLYLEVDPHAEHEKLYEYVYNDVEQENRPRSPQYTEFLTLLISYIYVEHLSYPDDIYRLPVSLYTNHSFNIEVQPTDNEFPNYYVTDIISQLNKSLTISYQNLDNEWEMTNPNDNFVFVPNTQQLQIQLSRVNSDAAYDEFWQSLGGSLGGDLPNIKIGQIYGKNTFWNWIKSKLMKQNKNIPLRNEQGQVVGFDREINTEAPCDLMDRNVILHPIWIYKTYAFLGQDPPANLSLSQKRRLYARKRELDLVFADQIFQITSEGEPALSPTDEDWRWEDFDDIVFNTPGLQNDDV